MTTAFDHRELGTQESRWLARGFDDWPTIQLPGPGERVLVLAAHPDDETLGAGGVISELAARGVDVRVVIATDGEASHPHSPTHTPMQLATIRRAEVRAALTELHPGLDAVFLGLPDGALDRHRDALDAMLTEHVRDRTHIITPWIGDRHPDHASCAEVVDRLRGDRVRHWQYPIWAWHWDDPTAMTMPLTALRRVMLSPAARAAKRRALTRHRSQHAALSDARGDEAILGPETLAHFDRDFEGFVVEAPAARTEYFDRLYEAADDPWGLADRFYERRKRELVMAVLPRSRFRRAFEPGCATGLLTAELATRCDQVVAWDPAAAAARQTRLRLGAQAAVEISRRGIPEQWPTGRFDLVVLSEVGYYCLDLDRLADRVRAGLARDGVVVAVHWRHDAIDHPHSAADVHQALGQHLHPLVSHVEPDFLLDVWTTSAVSVAQAEGLIE